jgi:hypothetical protein
MRCCTHHAPLACLGSGNGLWLAAGRARAHLVTSPRYVALGVAAHVGTTAILMVGVWQCQPCGAPCNLIRKEICARWAPNEVHPTSLSPQHAAGAAMACAVCS